MSVETIARRYGAALADVVAKSGEAQTVKSELKSWEVLINANRELRSLFANPAIAHLDKESILEKLIARAQPGKTTANFLKVLLRNGRLGELAEINTRFDAELEARSGNVVAKVTSARDLTDSEKAELSANMTKLTGKHIIPAYTVDKGIIGGVVTQIGSTVYDGSVKTQLENLREELVNG
ncbi:MAG: ATP synthase F1 subunit delta [Acidobacteria bacterium]|nr:ATP synthase F1 subunit delta [Acidobacteriota bacterium]